MKAQRMNIHGLIVEALRRTQKDANYHMDRGDYRKYIVALRRYQVCIHLYHVTKIGVTDYVIQDVKTIAHRAGVRI